MTAQYFATQSGLDSNDGLTPTNPKKDFSLIAQNPNDFYFFKSDEVTSLAGLCRQFMPLLAGLKH